MANDLKDIDYSRFSRLDPEQSQVVAASTQGISLQDQNLEEFDVVESKEASILRMTIIKDSGLAKHEPLLLKICNSLKPVFYNEHHYIVREGDPIDAVFLITEGIVWTCTSNNGEGSDPRHAERLGKGQYLGRKLFEWVLRLTSDNMYNLSKLPISSKTLKTHTKVEAFALMAHDLKQIWHSKLSRLGQEQLQSKAAARVQ
ncbi:hypothetical protein CMV_027794 [Castanea mollissima]|uniref:Cyclic nucleotide-binding domain-containing protein n=1 Tax=Castanea mollissima TaxID=60419 RepID=A0A8J4QIU7_9ROSI|nr:hypothetical protein CMV_027794 [Castanea mollissima]